MSKNPDQCPELKFEYLPVETLIPYARNAKKHTDAHVAELAASLREFGFVSPVVISENNTIVAGHGRILAARKLGMEKVPCVRESHLSDTQRRAYTLADNKLVGDEWDGDMLALELQELKALDFALELTGFSAKEIDDTFSSSGGGGGEGAESVYTQKVQSPVYTPKGEKPKESELYDTSKADELLREVEGLEAPEEVKAFLRQAAQRHTVFDYEKIAEYYCHAPKNVQELMENSALVIIDFQKAIQKGFVKLTKELAEVFAHDSQES